jgi:pantothenate kinase
LRWSRKSHAFGVLKLEHVPQPNKSSKMAKAVTLDDIVHAVRSHAPARRTITALAGPPGSGKSTSADLIAEKLNQDEPDSAAVVPMDGFHYDDIVLLARGLRPRKGAPETFDCAGFAHLMARLAANTEEEIAIPVFDRSIEMSRGSARIIPNSVKYIVTEGNYLLLKREPWARLRRLFDITVFLHVDRDELRRRLLSRWQNLSPAELTAKMEGNDMVNVETVLQESSEADFVLANG